LWCVKWIQNKFNERETLGLNQLLIAQDFDKLLGGLNTTVVLGGEFWTEGFGELAVVVDGYFVVGCGLAVDETFDCVAGVIEDKAVD
jgi:hypothetical protein